MTKSTAKAYSAFLKTCRELAELQESRRIQGKVNNDLLQQKIGAAEILVFSLGLKDKGGQDVKSSMKKLKIKNYQLLISQKVNDESVFI